jgi:hypothetical protein
MAQKHNVKRAYLRAVLYHLLLLHGIYTGSISGHQHDVPLYRAWVSIVSGRTVKHGGLT